MKFISLLFGALCLATNIPPEEQRREAFKLVVEPELKITTGVPFSLKYTIIAPSYITKPRRNPIGPKYDINPFSIQISFESMPRPNQYENRHIWYSEFWPVGNLDFDPQVSFVLPHRLPAGTYRFVAKFVNLSDRDKEYDPAYSYVINLQKGSETRYDDLFYSNKAKGTRNDSDISIVEQEGFTQDTTILAQIPTKDGKYELKSIGPKSKYIF